LIGAMGMNCPKCGKPLKKWYSGSGGRKYIGCEDLSGCGYKYEIDERGNPI